MSNQPRRSGGSKKKSAWRRPVLIFVVLLALVLVGTVIVLSTVVHYFGVDKRAFLTEDEVPWRPEDVIKPLLDPVPQTELSDGAESGSAETPNAKRAEDFTEILDGDVADDTDVPSATAESAVSQPATSADAPATEEGDDVWGIDGKGTGGYWMRKDWDGKVANTHSWDRLYNVTTRWVRTEEA